MKSEGQVYLYKEYSVLNIACNLRWLNIPKIGTKNGQKDFIKFWLKLCAWNILFDENIHTFILTMFYLTSFSSQKLQNSESKYKFSFIMESTIALVFTRSFSQQITSTHAWMTLKTCWQHSLVALSPFYK